MYAASSEMSDRLNILRLVVLSSSKVQEISHLYMHGDLANSLRDLTFTSAQASGEEDLASRINAMVRCI